MEFTVDMLRRATLRRTRSDQVDRHIISLATGITYAELGFLPQRQYNEYMAELTAEVTPTPIRLTWDSGDSKWVVSRCECVCQCDDCGFFITCVPCECRYEGSEIIRFREVLQNDIERVNSTGTPNYPELVEVVSGVKLADWRLGTYKLAEMAVARSMMAPLPSQSGWSTGSPESDLVLLTTC